MVFFLISFEFVHKNEFLSLFLIITDFALFFDTYISFCTNTWSMIKYFCAGILPVYFEKERTNNYGTESYCYYYNGKR